MTGGSNPIGWKCPDCGQVNAPWVGTCLHETRVVSPRREEVNTGTPLPEGSKTNVKEEEFYS